MFFYSSCAPNVAMLIAKNLLVGGRINYATSNTYFKLLDKDYSLPLELANKLLALRAYEDIYPLSITSFK
jgi:hypothetical protein